MNSPSLLLRFARGAAVALFAVVSIFSAAAFPFTPSVTVPKNALKFGGGSQYVEVSSPAAFDLSTPFTIEAWINVTAFDKVDMAVITKGDDWGIYRDGNSTRLTFRTKNASTTHNLFMANNLTLGRWYHIVAVFDGTTKYIYQDGVLNASAPFAGPVKINALPVFFGANAASANKNFNGQLEAIRIWSRARSLTEIRADIDRDLRGDEAGLLGEWRFNEPSGMIATDSSIAHRDGSLRNMLETDRVNGIVFRSPPPVATLPGTGMRFDKDDRQYVVVASRFEPDFRLTGTTLTVEAWVNFAAFDQPWQAIVTKGEAWGLTRNNATSKLAFRTKSGAVVQDLVSASDLLLNRWYHVAAVYDGAQKRIYLDGILDASTPYAAALEANNLDVVIGGNSESMGRDFRGDMDVVRIWSIARTEAALNADLLRNLRGSETGLLGEWRFNEGAGPVAIDNSYVERQAVLVNMTDAANRVAGLALTSAPPPVSAGATGALRFSGAAGAVPPRVIIPSEDQFDVTAQLTFEAWILIEAFDKPWQAVITKGDSWGLTRYGESNLLDFRTQRGLEFHDLPGNTPLELNRWYHVAAVFDGTQKRLYLNGALDASAPLPESLEVNDLPVVIGANAAQGNRAFRGQMDGVRLWSSARTDEDIRLNFERDLRGSEPGLIGDWRFNETSGTVAIDNSARHLDGTLTDMALPTDRVGGLWLRRPADGELAIAFDQSGATKQFIQLPDESKFDFPGQFSVETWVYFDNLPASTVALVSKGSSAWELLLRPSGKLQFSTAGLNDPTAIPPTDLVSASALPIKSWQHIAVTWSPLTGTKSIYLNGVLDESHAGIAGTLAQNNSPVVFAAQPLAGGGQGSHFQGALDEMRLWISERTGERILDNSVRKLTGLEPQLAGVWSMNEGSGGSVLDGRAGVSPSNGALSVEMSPLNRVDGQPLGAPATPQYALLFNGTDEYVTILDNAAFTLIGKATFEAWVRPTGSGWRTILSKGSTGYGLAIDDQNRLRFYIDSNRDKALASDARLQNDVWQHVAVVVNNSPAGTAFYINGKPAGLSSTATLANQPGPLWLGRRSDSAPSDYFAGQMDEVRIWNVARSAQEVEFFAFRSPSPQSAGLATYWAFNEGRSLTLADLGASRLDGVLQNIDDSNWQDGQLWATPSVDANLNLQADGSSKGLWIGNITLNRVNEVQSAINGAAQTATPTADAASIRVLLHVDAAGKVRLLKDVVIMQTYTNPQDINSPKRMVLVTDPRRIPQFQGIVQRGGKTVGLRHGSVSYDFEGNSLLLVGGVGKGVACAGGFKLSPDTATNPFRHRYHPDHRSGYAIGRQFSFDFNGAPGDPLTEGPNYGVQRLTGSYKETISGLHKIALRVEGVVTLDRISTVDVLNDGQFD